MWCNEQLKNEKIRTKKLDRIHYRSWLVTKSQFHRVAQIPFGETFSDSPIWRIPRRSMTEVGVFAIWFDRDDHENNLFGLITRRSRVAFGPNANARNIDFWAFWATLRFHQRKEILRHRSCLIVASLWVFKKKFVQYHLDASHLAKQLKSIMTPWRVIHRRWGNLCRFWSAFNQSGWPRTLHGWVHRKCSRISVADEARTCYPPPPLPPTPGMHAW